LQVEDSPDGREWALIHINRDHQQAAAFLIRIKWQLSAEL
jgi:hypothetical protein